MFPNADLYVRAWKAKRLDVCHVAHFKFKREKLTIGLLDEPTQTTHFFLSPGLLLRYFQRKKSLKKNRSMRILMVRFLRKVLLILNLSGILIRFKGVPLYANLFLNTLFRPVAHPFLNPFSGEVIDEASEESRPLNIIGLHMSRPVAYGYQKTRKKGRVKRKIRRKIARLNSVLDEM